ncbi:MAG: tetratricopeptide repeat protein [Acidobacteriota bacterium]
MAHNAITLYQQVLSIVREIGNCAGEATILGALGNLHLNLGYYEQAIEYFQEALTIFQQIGDGHAQEEILNNLGDAYLAIGRIDPAIDCYEQQLRIAKQLGDHYNQAQALLNKSLALDERGEHERAIMHAEISLGIYEWLNSPNVEVIRKQLAQWRDKQQESLSFE